MTKFNSQRPVLALKHPWGRESNFPQGQRYSFGIIRNCLHNMAKFQKFNQQIKLWVKKDCFWPFQGIFDVLSPQEHDEIFFQKSENNIFTFLKLQFHVKFQRNSMGGNRDILEQLDSWTNRPQNTSPPHKIGWLKIYIEQNSYQNVQP